jgi:hypothetical protein
LEACLAEGISFSISSLNKFPHLADFFSKNLDYARSIGQDAESESRFFINLSKDLAFFKKVTSYEEKKKPGKFNVRATLSSFNTPVKGPEDRKQGQASSEILSKDPASAAGGASSSDEKTMATLHNIYKTIKRHNDEKRFSRNMSLQTASYLSTKPDIVKDIPPEQALSFKDKAHQFSLDVREAIGGKTFNAFEGKTAMTPDSFMKRIEESLFIILNIGDILSILQTDEAARGNFSKGTLYAKESLKEDIALEAYARMGIEGASGDVLAENLEAAAYLLENATFREEILRSASSLSDFVETMGRSDNPYAAYVVSKAQSLLSNGAFSGDLLSNNIEFSALVVGSEHLGRPYSLSQYLNAHPELVKEEFDINTLIFKYQTASLKDSLPQGVRLSENFFQKNTGILNTALSDPAFKKNLQYNIQLIERFFSSDSGEREPLEAESSSEAYLSGLSEREEQAG